MVRRKPMLLFLIILLGLQEQISAKRYDLKRAIEDVEKFIPVPGHVIEKGLAAYETFNDIVDTLNGVPTEASVNQQLSAIDEKISEAIDQGYRNEEKIDDLKELIPIQIQTDFQIREIFELIEKMNSTYQDFLHEVLERDFANATLLQKAENFVLETSSESIKKQLNEIKVKLSDKNSRTSLLHLLQNKKQASEMMCVSKHSSMQLLNIFYNEIVKTEMKGLVMAMWANDQLKTEENDREEEKRSYTDSATIRINEISLKIKKAMRGAPRDFWLCDPTPKKQGVNYDLLDPFIRTQIFPEIDAAEKRGNELIPYKDKGSCEDFENKDNLVDLCETDFCAKEIVNGKCQGFIRECYLHEKGSKMDVCIANPNKFHGKRKYMSVKIDDKVYGNGKDCSFKKVSLEQFDFLGTVADKFKQEYEDIHWYDYIPLYAAGKAAATLIKAAPKYKKENCICTCDEAHIVNETRYFSLREPAVSDIENNKVVTGARIVKKNLQIQLEIRQGTLLEDGNVGEDDDWKLADSVTHLEPGKNVHKLTWNERQVNIDQQLEAPTGSVLTGLRFEVESGHVKLGIRYTPFDFNTGKLRPHLSQWKSNPNNLKDTDDIDRRRPLEIKTALPTDVSQHSLSPIDNAFIKFTTSSFEKDVGQTVVPFIDTQSLISDPSTLLSGAGLVYRESAHSAGFLALKLYTFDYYPHLHAQTAQTRRKTAKGHEVIYKK